MDKNIFKKTIALAYLFIFAIGLFIPLSSIFAQTPTGIIVTTGDANVVSPEEATVNGSWSFSSAYSGNQNTTTWVEYGTTATPTGWSSSPPVLYNNGIAGELGADLGVSCDTNLLTSDTTYYWRAAAKDSAGNIYYGKVKNFKTEAFGPTGYSNCPNSNHYNNKSTLTPDSPLSISTNTPNITTGKTATINANLLTVSGGEKVTFNSPSGGIFDSMTCIIPASASTCSVNFTPPATTSATYKVTASVVISGKTYTSNTVPIVVSVTLPNNGENNNNSAPTKTTYEPLAPLPGEPTSIDTQKSDSNPCPFGNYLNIIIKLTIGIAAVLAMVMIVMGGVEYMTSDLVSNKEAGKETITHAILGLLLALGAFMILNTINPQLLSACLNNLPQATITISSGDEYRLSQTQATDTKFKRTSFYDKIKAASSQNNIPNCLLQVAIQRESGGRTGLVGHDEDAPSLGIPARKSFATSTPGKKYSGATFTPNDNLITDKTFYNDDNKNGNLFSASNPSADNLGLDWRFSHSVGLFGVTYFPGGNYAEAKDILNNPDKDISKAVGIMSGFYKKCGGDIEKTFRGYGSGSCTSNTAFIGKEAPLRKGLYDQCLTQDK